MEVVYLNDANQKHLGAAVALGNFDGVHVGHQEILRACIRYAKEHGLKSAAMIFDPHPSAFFKGEDFKPLMTLEQKLEKLKSLGLEFVVINKFDDAFSKTTAEDFIKKILCEKLAIKYVATGFNFFFGHKRQGDINYLSEQSTKLGFQYQKIDQVTLDYMNVSSSKIRELLAQGRVSTARAMLGNNFPISGKVIEGQKMAGTILGTPTANIALNTDICLPLFGVYIVSVKVDQKKLFGIANIGIKPTFDNKTPLLEVNIFDFNSNLYGKKLDVELLVFMRPERKFATIEDLKWQIDFDTKSAKYAVKNLDKWYRKV